MPRKSAKVDAKKKKADPKRKAAEPSGWKTILLAGEQTLQQAEQARADLLAAIDGEERVRIDLDGATAVDVAFAQVLLAAVREAAKRGRPVELAGIENSGLPALFNTLGLISSEKNAERFLDEFAGSEAAA